MKRVAYTLILFILVFTITSSFSYAAASSPTSFFDRIALSVYSIVNSLLGKDEAAPTSAPVVATNPYILDRLDPASEPVEPQEPVDPQDPEQTRSTTNNPERLDVSLLRGYVTRSELTALLANLARPVVPQPAITYVTGPSQTLFETQVDRIYNSMTKSDNDIQEDIAADISVLTTGTSGYVLQSTGTGSEWVATSSLGFAAASGASQWTTSGSDIYYSTGNVGIGTTSPTATLSIDRTNDNLPHILMRQAETGGRSYGFLLSDSGRFYLRDYTAEAIRFSIDSTGNVGIGTNAPLNILHVASSSLTNIDAIFENSNSDANGTVRLMSRFGTTNSTSKYGSYILYGKDQAWTSTASTQDGYISLNPALNGSNIEAMRVTSAGNVGVGTTSPYEKFSVDGNGVFTGSLSTLSLTTGTIISTSTATSTFAGSLVVGNHLSSPQIYATGGQGNIAMGRIQRLGSNPSPSSIRAQGSGTFAGGYAGDDFGSNTSVSNIVSSGVGSFAFGSAQGHAFSSVVPTLAGNIVSSGSGSVAMGYTNGFVLDTDVKIQSSGNGSVAMGIASFGNLIASGNASFALGNSLSATGNSSFAIGEYITNSTASTLMIGFGYGTPVPAFTVNDTKVGVSTTTPWAKLSVAGAAGGTAPLFTVSTSTSGYSTTTVLHIPSNGNVGIGTTSPDVRLMSVSNVAAFPLTSGTSQPGASLRLGSLGSNAVLDFGMVSSSGGWIQATNRSTQAVNYSIALNPNGGNIGIGTTTPGALLSIKQAANTTAGGIFLAATDNDARAIYMDTSGILHFVGSGSASPDATLAADGTWTSGSDRAFKKDIEDTRYGLEEVLKLKPRDYTVKSTGNTQIGFIAQEMEEVIPEVVSGKEGAKGIAYGNLAAVTISALQDLSEILDIGESASSTALVSIRLDTIETRITRLEEQGMFASLKEWVGETLTATLGIFKKVRVEEGIEMKDTETGDMYCVTITGGEWKKVKGECGAVQDTPSDTTGSDTTPGGTTEIEPVKDDIDHTIDEIPLDTIDTTEITETEVQKTAEIAPREPQKAEQTDTPASEPTPAATE